MREQLHPGGTIDGYQLGDCIHKGGTGVIYRATAPAQQDPGFPIVLKAPVPRARRIRYRHHRAGDGADDPGQADAVPMFRGSSQPAMSERRHTW